MKDAPPISACEVKFVQAAIAEGRRVDGRHHDDSRQVDIEFGVDRGSCLCKLGNTKTLSQVSCSISAPSESRPSEGILRVNVEFSPMAHPGFEMGRSTAMTDFGTEVTRILEKCIRDSRCLDLESLCIVAGEKVWTIRVDIHVLNHDGNIMECASIAAMASLAHFRRPDVTVVGTDVTVHTLEEHDPVPLSIHHWPLCVCFALFNQGKDIVVDPTELEEKVAEGKVVVSVNAHNELCGLHIEPGIFIKRDQILTCSHRAAARVKKLTEMIKQKLENDTKARATGEKMGFAASLPDRILTTKKASVAPDLGKKLKEAWKKPAAVRNTDEETSSAKETGKKDDIQAYFLGAGTAVFAEGGPSRWEIETDGNLILSKLQNVEVSNDKESPKPNQSAEKGGSGSESSEEEELVVLQPECVEMKEEKEPSTEQEENKSRQWYTKNPFM